MVDFDIFFLRSRTDERFINVLEQIACRFSSTGNITVNCKIVKQKQMKKQFYEIIKKYRKDRLGLTN